MKRFIECLVPDSFCNFKCSYCYVQQQARKSKKRIYTQYSPSYIAKALSPDRLGGVSYISITGLGETLIQEKVVQIVHEILKTGNYVNITTNGTLDKRFEQLLDFDKNLLRHLNISFSCHYVELKKHNMVNRFFSNIDKVRSAGCSFVLQINLVDEYLPYWDEIKSVSLERVGALPQVALTRKENYPGYRIMTDGTVENYVKKGREMESIYHDLNAPIVFKPLGCCCADYCVNSSHFLSLGVIPQISTPSYAELRNRVIAAWYNEELESFLSKKLNGENERVKYERLFSLCIPYMRRVKTFLRRWYLRMNRLRK